VFAQLTSAMFTFATRSLLRRAPLAIAAASGASFVTPVHFLQCSELQKSQSQLHKSQSQRSLRTQSKFLAPVTIKTGTDFVKLFVAEYKDKDGNLDVEKHISLAETTTLLEGAGGRVKNAKEMFDIIDEGHKGTITFANIIAYFLANADGSHDEKMAFLFHACDVDHSGTIEPDELKVVVHHLMKLKASRHGMESILDWHPVLFADIPRKYVLHMKANEFVNDVFIHAGRGSKKEISEKDFLTWHLRGGKESKRLDALLSLTVARTPTPVM